MGLAAPFSLDQVAVNRSRPGMLDGMAHLAEPAAHLHLVAAMMLAGALSPSVISIQFRVKRSVIGSDSTR